MANIIFNSFTKKRNSKTSYCLEKGKPIFGDTLYLLAPFYVHSKSPAFTLVWKGKHISGFFPVAGGGFTGDYKDNALLIYLRPAGFDLFATDFTPVELRSKLVTPDFAEDLWEARQKSSLV